MSHAGFDDDIRTQREDGLLQPDEVFRVLNDRASEPSEGIVIFLIPAGLEPKIRDQLESLFAVEVEASVIRNDERLVRRVDYHAHNRRPLATNLTPVRTRPCSAAAVPARS